MQKILAMHVAAQLTQAACGHVGGNLPISSDLSDNTVRAKNLQTWETFRVYYRGVLGALKDETSWPSPDFDFGSLLPNVIDGLSGLLQAGSPLAAIVQQVMAALPKPADVPSDRLPDPGVGE